MPTAISTPDPDDRGPRMGSEYASAPRYLARHRRHGTPGRWSVIDPVHAANDPDFEPFDPAAD